MTLKKTENGETYVREQWHGGYVALIVFLYLLLCVAVRLAQAQLEDSYLSFGSSILWLAPLCLGAYFVYAISPRWEHEESKRAEAARNRLAIHVEAYLLEMGKDAAKADELTDDLVRRALEP